MPIRPPRPASSRSAASRPPRSRPAPAPPPRRLVLLAVPPVQELDLTGPLAVFGAVDHARAASGMPPAYRVEVATAGPGLAVAGEAGLTMLAHARVADLRGAIDTLLVLGGNRPPAPGALDAALLAWLRRARPRVRRMGAVCTGAFVLAAAGLLRGRRATTHWMWCDALAAAEPTALVERDPIWVRDAAADGLVYTSAGVTAGIDLALALAEEDVGAADALAAARALVLFLRRPGGQAQFSTTLAAQAGETRALGELQAWVQEHLAERLTGPVLARHAGLSERHFARVFARETGCTPARYVARARVEAARRLLERTDRATADVAGACGFGSAEVMRRAFLREAGVTPQRYRAHFRTPGWRRPIRVAR